MKHSPKKRNFDQNVNDSKSRIWIFFWKSYLGYRIFIFIHTFQWTLQSFFNFRFSSSLKLTKAGEKIIDFAIQFRSKNLTHLTNLNSLGIENNMLLQHSEKPFRLYKFSSKHVSVWCRKKYLHCTISWSSRTAVILEALWKQMSVYFCIYP